MRILAWIVAVFWFLSMVFLGFTYQIISGEGGRYIMMMFTISVFGLAIVETLHRRSKSLG